MKPGVQKYTTETFNEELKRRNITHCILVGEYKGGRSKPKCLFKCLICSETYEARADHAFKKMHNKCSNEIRRNKSRGTQENFDKQLLKWKGTFIVRTGKYIDRYNPVDVKCMECGREWTVNKAGFLLRRKGNGCKVCSYKKNADSQRSNITELKSIVKNVSPTLEITTENYINNTTKVPVKCLDCEWQWECIPKSLKKGGGCPRCAADRKQVGKNERKYFRPYIGEIFNELHIDYIFQLPVPGIKRNSFFFVDVYLPDYNIMIEYDEPHHYQRKNQILDEQRQLHIENQNGSTFIRISDELFMKDKRYALRELSLYIIDLRHTHPDNIECLFE
jgi:very-short-patch-repair endonuclease